MEQIDGIRWDDHSRNENVLKYNIIKWGDLIIIEKSKICSWCTPFLQHLVIIVCKFKDSQSKFVALFPIKFTYSNYIIIQHGV